MLFRLLASVVALSALVPKTGHESDAQPPTQASPLNLTVLIDVSFTMHPRLPERSTDKFVNGLSAENIGRGLGRLFDLLGPGDRVRLVTFSGPPVFQTPFTGERSTLDGAVKRFEALTFDDRFGPSPIWDALVAAAEAPPTDADRRLLPHSILLISDGRATANRIRLNTAIDRLVALNTTVCAIGIPVKADFSDGQRTYVIDGADFLKRITDATGGLHLQYNPPDEHAFPLFERVLRYLRPERVAAGGEWHAAPARQS